MDFVILKVNGKDLSNATHEETVNSLNTAQEPIIVEVLRRPSNSAPPSSQTSTKSTQSTMSSIATQTESCSECCSSRMFTVPAPPPLNSSVEEVAALGLSSTELDESTYELEYEEVVLKRTSSSDRIGLTLCYGETEEDGFTDIYIGVVEENSVASKNGRVQEGDQIIKINNEEVRNREDAIRLFSENRYDIHLLICRPSHLNQMDDGFMEECVSSSDFDSFTYNSHDVKMMPLIEEERSEFEDDSTLTDTATLPSQKEKEGKDSGVGQDSAGSSEQECDSSHYDTIQACDELELTTELVDDCKFRQLIESRCPDLSVDQLCEKLNQLNNENNNRVVPRMGTKLINHNTEYPGSISRSNTMESQDTAYNTGDSCMSSPTTLELTKNLSGSAFSLSENKSRHSRRSHEKKKSRRSNVSLAPTSPAQSDIAYTTEDKIAETIAYQQKLLLEQSRNSTLTKDNNKTDTGNMSDNSNMEWVVKRRSDGTRYVTRRPIRTKILNERKKKLENERCGMTTDDDAMSEMKTGKHWSKEDRRRHMQKARDYHRRKAQMQQQAELVKKLARDGQTNIIELSQRKLQNYTMKDIDFVTVQELLAHRGKIPISASNLVSVTTV